MRLLASALCITVLLSGVASARPGKGGPDTAGVAIEPAQPLVPLADILDTVGQRYIGRVIAADVKRGRKHERTPVVYELRLLTEHGHVINIRFDAANGEFLGANGRGLVEARRK